MDAVKTVEKGRIMLCGVQGCCPSVDFETHGEVHLNDDFGGHVKLTTAQWNDLKAKFAGV